MEAPVRKFSFSSDISDLPSSPEADDRIEKIREALRQKEVESERRREAFRSRCRQVRKRIDTLQKARIDKLLENGIKIDIDVIRCTLSKEALLWKKKFENEERQKKARLDKETKTKKSEDKPPDILNKPFGDKVPERTPKITQEPVKTDGHTEGEKLLFSVQDELAKINRRPAEKEKKASKDKGKKVDNQNQRKSLVVAVAEEKNDVTSREQGTLENKKTPLDEFNRRETRRSSLTPEKPPNLPGRRRSSLDVMSPLLQRRRSSDMIQAPKPADPGKSKGKGRRRSVHEQPMWGDILKMGKENEKKDKKKKKK